MSRELTRNTPGNKEKRIKVAKLCKAFSFRWIEESKIITIHCLAPSCFKDCTVYSSNECFVLLFSKKLNKLQLFQLKLPLVAKSKIKLRENN